MMMIFIKIVVTSAIVLGLSWLSERVGPRIAGIFAGLPLGIAVSLFFMGVEQGPEFASSASLSALGGLGASLVFCYVYWKFSSLLGAWNAVLTSVISITVFLLVAAALGLLPQNRWILTAVTVTITGIAIFLFRDIGKNDAGSRKEVKVTPTMLVIRAAVATAILLIITGLANVIGEKWAGLLSGFPITLYPVLLIVHVTYSKEEAHGIIKGFPYGIGSLIICALAASYLLVPLGVYWGMLASIALSTIYLAAAAAVMWKSIKGT
ncbi:hypothetical protein NBZ79_14445 [Sneathiella marina]|uniref:DUF3147 family protein n=1 Tax=Sneathiella marina TaxID=2950108 RepID=A0ABY4W2N1_9PROT|nr:hypothetical protein [Sneathiella marina]USG60368.1 hypothetical protein NBZ79_14445 [Sneathiella marina]